MRSYEERCKTYTNALVTYGDRHQMIVAVEELSECIAEMSSRESDRENLTEEIADVLICMEQLDMIFHLGLYEEGDVRFHDMVHLLSLCQKEICKVLRGGESFPTMAASVRAVQTWLGRYIQFMQCESDVADWMEAKVERLDERLRNGR